VRVVGLAVEGDLEDPHAGQAVSSMRTLNGTTFSYSTAIGENAWPAQSAARNSPSSIKPSGLMSSSLPANDDSD
jgi:hypothetical protein